MPRRSSSDLRLVQRLYKTSVVSLVTAYLAAVGIWLAFTRQIPLGGIRKLVFSRFRPRYKAGLKDCRREIGFCWQAELPSYLISDADGLSHLILFENDQRLPLGHAPHEEIRQLGGGRYSHWGTHIYFSTPDNTDPTRNGRRYTVEELP